MAGRLHVALLVLVGLVVAPVVRAGELDWLLKLEAGSEYDSNVFRLETAGDGAADVAASPLARLGARWQLDYRIDRRRKLDSSGFVGSKLFATEEAQSENVVVSSGTVGGSAALPGRAAVASLRGSVYDAENVELRGAGRPVPGRTFRTSSAEALIAMVGKPGHRVSFSGGYRWFRYKPDPDFDWDGVTVGAGYSGTIWLGERETDPDVASIDIGVSYRLDQRDFGGLAFRNQCGPDEMLEPRCSIPTDAGRADLMHLFTADLSYTGHRIYGLRYQAQYNDSNSFTESFIRHRVDATVTTELPWQLYLTARATVQLNVFLDSLLLTRDVNSQTFVSIDDENRNALSLVLSRDIGGGIALEGRYLFFTNEFATRELDFRRQTVYFGLVYSVGS